MNFRRMEAIRIDEKVILSMAGLCVLSLMVMAFRYGNRPTCDAVNFTISSNTNQVGRIIYVVSDAEHARTWQWNFGDRTAADAHSGPIATHVYNQPGDYRITLTINGECTHTQKLRISSNQLDTLTQASRQEEQRISPVVNWPSQSIFVGQSVVFADHTPGAYAWVWYIGDGKDSRKLSDKEVIYTFKKSGSTTVRLEVNGDKESAVSKTFKVLNLPHKNDRRKGGGRPIVILQRPAEEEEVPAALPEVTKPLSPEEIKLIRTDLEALLVRAARKQADAASFDKYAPGSDHTSIRVMYERNKRDVVQMNSLAYAIDKLREERIKTLEAYPTIDEKTNKVYSIHIKVKTRFL